jgi:predicted permease
VKTVPGVEDAALGSGAAVPLDHPEQDPNVMRVLFKGASQGALPTIVTGSEVTPEYFRLLGFTLLRGRLLRDVDTDNSPHVAVINESMARKYWPNEDAIGKRLKLSRRDTVWTTVVGVIADARTESLAIAGVPHLYASLYQRQGKHLAIFLRGHLAMATIARRIRDEVQAINPALPVFGAETLDDVVSDSLAVRRFSLRVIELFAVMALLLASLGIYGVVAYTVSERTHEIGVRMALGARGVDVLRMVLWQGVTLVAAGVAVGAGGALIAGYAMAGLLFGISPLDPVTFGVVTAILAAVAFAGCYLPARRAMRADPVTALRY